ncbi:1ff30a75-5909-452e-b9d0-a062951eb9fd [Thermothielavioides terrestris]|uniref:1ff30a75-5909-452e-b9d0-a062951eb9fd n=1 Tax=Thermothielavioides terrestris TaxID=2587410 RepID=A0A3S4BQ72_9PEZI|nr:1ff30a75-5909-452e-b9d0-a062951eb9fd [Thermothielavioides terrestris]
MWLLESDLFEGRKLWLRPGKLYLFGRTAAEPGQLAVSDKTISRKHITIQVENVIEGGGRNLRSRSTVTVEDLDSKKGTILNGVQIRGQKKTLSEDENELKLGMCPKILRIRWHPVVLSFSFTAKELSADPWTRLRESLEQLDIKYSAEYEKETTHVVSKKRNTSKGLQALINGAYVVTDSFINAIVDAAAIPDDAEAGTNSALEEDFDAAWPNPIDHLPPRGAEPVDRPPESYAPDDRRQEVFEGYTFVFYERKQYENLLPAITAGKGKALLKEVVPGETGVDDFVRYVKGVAGEKGLGSFEDGSEGRGVVVVRYTPKTEDYEWFAQFLTSFAQRLDHRPIDQREFLEAILACDASMLRRPLEEASQPASAVSGAQEPIAGQGDRMDVDQPAPQGSPSQEPVAKQESGPTTRRGRDRRAGRSRFKGFDFDDDAEGPIVETPPVEPPEPPQVAAASQDSLFVSQHREPSLPLEKEVEDAPPTRRTLRKRALSPLPEHDNSALMDEIAPTTAAAKRRRIEAGQAPVPPPPEPEPEPEPQGDESEEMVPDSPQGKPKKGQARKGKGKKVKEEGDILELARRKREEAEAQAAAKRKELEELPDDGIDYAAIRALHIIEECEVHFPDPDANKRGRDQDIADGRWDPRWNGRKNFKRFRKQGEPTGRPAPQIIIGLEEVKPKEYGIGDDYWLEEEGSGRRKKDSQRDSQTRTQQQSQEKSGSAAKGKEKEKEKEKARPALRRTILAVDSSDEEEERSELGTVPEDSYVPETEPSRSRAAKAAEKANSQRGRSQTQTQSQSQAPSSNKRPAAAEPAKERAAKRPWRGFQPPSDDESEDSDDELKFRFGRRR